MSSSLRDQRLRQLAFFAIVLVHLVAIAGSVVRATGSGMGCPDWPLCFGRVIPPTDVSQIPARWLPEFISLGHGNLFHTWVEWGNRMVGAASGLATLGLLIGAVFARQAWPLVWRLLLGGICLFAVVVWLGAVVVDSKLDPRQISIHMLGGLLYTLSLVAAREFLFLPSERGLPADKGLRWGAGAVFMMVFAQIFLGTQVREVVDGLPTEACCDGRLVDSLGERFWFHRLGAYATVSAVGLLWVYLWRRFRGALRRVVVVLGGLVVAEFCVGLVLVKAGLPGAVVPVHLLLGFILASLCLSLWIRALRSPLP